MGHKTRKKGRPITAYNPPNRQIRTGVDPARYNEECLSWRLRNLDLDGAWGWKSMPSNLWWDEIWSKLIQFETMTWNEILAASGGRTKGNNHHPVPINELQKDAQVRLSELGQDDIDEVFSLRLSGTQRIYGIREGRVLKILWFDGDHGDNDGCVCRSILR